MAHVASPRRTWRRAKPTRFHAGIRYRRGRDALNREGTGTALTMELREVGRYERHGGGLLLPKHIPAVARRRLAWPDVAFTCTDNRWTWPGVARCRPSLAPNLAPRDILSAANLQRRGPRTSIRRWGGGWMPTTSPLRPTCQCTPLPISPASPPASTAARKTLGYMTSSEKLAELLAHTG